MSQRNNGKKEPLKGQSSLLSFFSKPAPASSSGSRPSNATTPSVKATQSTVPSTALGSKTPVAMKRVVSHASSTKSAATTPTSEDDDKTMDVDHSTQPSSELNSSSSKKPIPAKRGLGDLDSDTEEEDTVAAPRKRSTAGKQRAIVESEDDDLVVQKPKKKAAHSKSKPSGKKSLGDDSDFAASGSAGSASEDYFDDDLDDFIADMEVPETATKAKSKPASSTKAKSSPVPSRPALKQSGSGSGGISHIKTQAETNRAHAKDKKMSNEQVFSFLVDPKDADGNRPGDPEYDPRTLYIPSAAWKSFTPFETQFWEIKQNHYDTVLFFQKGKFFELYEEDAAIGHREFDLKLTDRVKMKMVGVPESSFDFWAAKFLAQGYKVGRVDQCETALGAELRVKDGKAKGGKPVTASNGKAIVRRELRSVLTGGTIVDGSLLTDDLANHCVAIKEHTPTSSSTPTFGICVLDASTAEFQLSSFSDDACRTQVETLIRQLKPKELIHEKGNLSVSTLRLLRSCLSVECQWTALKPGTEFLREDDTKAELRKLFGKGADDNDEDSAVPANVRAMYDKPIAMSALGGMIWYLRQLNLDTDLVTNKNFNIYDPLSQGKALVLDGQTLAHIEVLQNSQGGTEGTLLQLLSRCVTPFGKRLFKVWLCAPLREVSAINDRLDAVEDLIANSNFCATFDSMTKSLPDLERLLSRVHAKSIKKKDFLRVIKSFRKVATGMDTLTTLAEDFKSKGVPGLLRTVPDISTVLDEVESLYTGEELLPVEGKDPEYERVSSKVQEVEDALDEQLEQAKKDLKCKDIQFKDIGSKDIFQLEVPASVKVPNNWVKMSSTKAVNRYWSPEVSRLVVKLKEARERKTAVVNEFEFTVYAEFDKEYAIWLDVVKVVAELDCLMSLSKSSTALGEPCVRPEIVESDVAIVDFEELRHPCILSASTDFIPNDVGLGGTAERMILLTGPNMAGKSTLLRMTCAAVIMAQLGCFVPAARARIAPVDAIYSRMGANDFIFANSSTFKVEMDDCNKILTKATPRSLVILDELGRGTSTYDGMAIAFAVLHQLSTHVGCVGFFATHFTSLTDDFAYHPQIRLCAMATQVDNDSHSVVFLYKLQNGISPKSYGPRIAALAGLPDAVVDRAVDISKQFETTSRARERAQRANESLPLTAQADAAFLIQLARLGISGVVGGEAGVGKKSGGVPNAKKKQLLRTLKIIAEGVRRADVVKTQMQAQVVDMVA